MMAAAGLNWKIRVIKTRSISSVFKQELFHLSDVYSSIVKNRLTKKKLQLKDGGKFA